MRKPNLDLYQGMPNKTMISSKEIMKVFGYKKKVPSGAENCIPEPDLHGSDLVNKHGKNPFSNSKTRLDLKYWYLGTLRKLNQEANNNAG